ncbi:MAG: zinc-ribbon domain-containing protein [Herpetosiphonaceae bacterium]|nr:zinc-ribbon domain-containing protein [Herpetosiphonaceae bacterium]
MIIIGSRFFTWGSDRAAQPSHCGKCGTVAQFIVKRGMRFITLFFIIPIIPISGVRHLVQCPNCGTRYQATAEGSAVS